MSDGRKIRSRFFSALLYYLDLQWPILSGVLVITVGSGLVIGRIEGWSLGDALYFTFVTGLTIGYGDLIPKYGFARILALVIGLCGVAMTGIIAAVSVQALSHANSDPEA